MIGHSPTPSLLGSSRLSLGPTLSQDRQNTNGDSTFLFSSLIPFYSDSFPAMPCYPRANLQLYVTHQMSNPFLLKAPAPPAPPSPRIPLFHSILADNTTEPGLWRFEFTQLSLLSHSLRYTSISASISALLTLAYILFFRILYIYKVTSLPVT